jgi:hypothetical protein
VSWKPNPVWAKSNRVAVDSLRSGQQFLAIDGNEYTYDRRDGGHTGVHLVTRADGLRNCFAACATVVIDGAPTASCSECGHTLVESDGGWSRCSNCYRDYPPGDQS